MIADNIISVTGRPTSSSKSRRTCRAVLRPPSRPFGARWRGGIGDQTYSGRGQAPTISRIKSKK